MRAFIINDLLVIILVFEFFYLLHIGSLFAIVPFFALCYVFIRFVFSIEEAMADLRRIYKE